VRGRLFKLAAASALALLAWGGVVEPRLIAVTELRLNAPVSNFKTIAVIADLHFDVIGTREQRLLEIIQQRQPDTVILLGDVVDGPDDLPELERFLSALPASQRLAIFGNWEYWGGIDHDALRDVYAKHGVRLLINDCHEGIVGLDDSTAGQPDLKVALARCRSAAPDVSPFLLLEHSPGFFENTAVDPANFSLNLAGHTHGGQISIFGFAPWIPHGSGSFVAGEYSTRFGRLYVTRGIGTSVIPLRIGARPEIVFITTS